MTTAFSAIFLHYANDLLGREGGAQYTNRPADKGGPTKFGVTAKKLGEWRKLARDATPEEVQGLQRAEALEIFYADFWVEPGFEAISKISPLIASELLDSSVNLGTYYPKRWLQENLNLFNNRGRAWPDILVDAQIGKKTIEALTAFIGQRGQTVAESLMLKGLNGDQWARYKAIATADGPNSPQEENFVGWIANRIGAVQ